MTVERLLHALADGRTHSGEELAREFGVTLVGFLREDDFNVYTHAERIEV